MPKLLIINITCNQGSTGKISEQVGLMMKEREWDVYYAHGARRVNPSQLKTIPFSSVKDEYLHALKSLLFDADGLGSSCATKKLVEQIKEIQPDVIQIHNIHGYYLNYKVLFEYLNTTDIPVVITLHDCWNFTGHCTHFVTAGCEKWKAGCYECPLLNVPPKSYVDRSKRNYALKKALFSANKNLHIVPVSHWLEGMVRESFLKDKDIQVIQNGIDLNVFKPLPKVQGSKFKILGVSNVWNKDKGIFDIYKLRESLSVAEYEITLVGLTQKQIDELPNGINGITSTANQQELAKLYSDADVLINPTYADTFPTVNLEALACGTPVITYRTGGSPESLSPETGIVVEQGDVDAMANAIMQLRNKPMSTEMCRKHADESFDKNEHFRDYVNLYKELVGGGNFLIISVANVWIKDKGLYDFIELSKYLKEDEKIVLVGFDSSKSKVELPDNIIPLPLTRSQEELAFLYSISVVVVSMSYAETFGLTIAEGAACGIPGIVYDNTAQPALITDRTGYVVRTGDVKSVYESICKIRGMGKGAYFDACIAKAHEYFNKDRCFERYVELYESLVKNV